MKDRINRHHLAAWLLVAYCVPAVLHARIAPARDINILVANAELVVVGEISTVRILDTTSVNESGVKIPAELRLGTLKVNQVLKGSFDGSTLEIEYTVPQVPLKFEPPYVNRAVIVFLRQSGRKFVFSDEYYASIPTKAGVSAEGASPLERVLDVTAALAEDNQAPAWERIDSLRTLIQGRHAYVETLLRENVVSADASLRRYSTAVLISRGDTDLIEGAVDELLRPVESESSEYIANLQGSIANNVTSSKALRSVLRLLKAKDPILRRTAASALGNIGATETIPILRVALNDGDFETRYLASQSLARLTGDAEYRSSVIEFRADESKYMNHWNEKLLPKQ